MAKVVGLGGIFFKSPDPEALGAWYAEHLGVAIEPSFGGIIFRLQDMPAGAYNLWSPFKADSDYFAPSGKDFMINLAVDDLDGMLARLRAAGATLHGEPERSEFGSFGWFSDPDGNKVELWQPPAGDGG